jgi:hypothetical protein
MTTDKSDKRTLGSQLGSVLIVRGLISFGNSLALTSHHLEQAAAEFATPYLARVAELEAENKSLRDTKTKAEKLAAYWEKGAAHTNMPDNYRSGLKDCAKELRETLDP